MQDEYGKQRHFFNVAGGNCMTCPRYSSYFTLATHMRKFRKWENAGLIKEIS